MHRGLHPHLACPSLPAARSCASTSDAFDSPQQREDYRDVFRKGALPRILAPRRRRPQNKEAVLRRLCFCAAARPNAASRGLRKTRTDARRTMFFEAEAASPAIVYRCTHRYCGMAALGRAAQRTDVGGLWCLRARTFVRRAQSRGLQTEHRGFCRGRSIGHVRYFVSRRV